MTAEILPSEIEGLRPDDFTPEEWRAHAGAAWAAFDDFEAGFTQAGDKQGRQKLETLARQHRAENNGHDHRITLGHNGAHRSRLACGEKCTYVPKMVGAWPTDTPPKRHPWYVSQRVRLECARILGCTTEQDYATALSILDARLTELCSDRRVDEGEIRRAGTFAAETAAAKSESELWAELGDHKHGHAGHTLRPRERVAAEPRTEAATAAAPEAEDGERPLYADVALFLAGKLPDPPTPTVLTRQDGRQLFYRGQVNTVFGDPESGKTFVALAACAESLCAGGPAVFLDLDHNTMPAIVLRLLMFGVPREILADPDRFRYCEPMGVADLHRVVADCERWRPGVVVVDSLGELLPMVGASSDSADDFTRAHAAVLKPLARCGAAVIVVDHLAKNPTSRTHGPGGTMAKRRVLGGVSLRVKVARAFAPGKGGSAYLIVNKDRHGGVRAHCAAGEREPMAGTFVLDPPDADGVCGWRVVPPLPTMNVDERGREYLAALREAAPAAVTAEQLAELVSGEPPATKSQTEKARHWLARLTEDGHAEIAREGGRGRGQSTWKWAEPRAMLAEQPTLLEVEGLGR